MTNDEYIQCELDWFNNGAWDIYNYRSSIRCAPNMVKYLIKFPDLYFDWAEDLDTHFRAINLRKKYVEPLKASDYYTQDELDWFNNIDGDFYELDFCTPAYSYPESTELFNFCVKKGWCPKYEWSYKFDKYLDLHISKNEGEVNSDYDRYTSELKILEFIDEYELLCMDDMKLRIIRDHPERFGVPKDMDVENLFNTVKWYKERSSPKYDIDYDRDYYETMIYVIDFIRKYDLRNKMCNDLNEKIMYFAYYSLANQK